MGGVVSQIQDAFSTVAGMVSTLRSVAANYQSVFNRIHSGSALPVPNPTSSYWMQDPPFPSLCDLRHDLPSEVDIVIIGSGITGAAAAKTICELSASENQQLTVAVLEARQLCSGATARNGGHIKCVPHEEFGRLRELLGEEAARRVVRLQMSHLGVLGGLGETIPVGEVREVETVDLYLEREDFEKAKESVRELESWMPEYEVRVWEGKEGRLKFGYNSHVAGAVSYKAGALWPYRLVTGVWDDLLKRYSNLAISTHTPVTSITPSPSSASHPYTVHTSRGSLQAHRILHATNGYLGHLIPSLRGQVTGILGHMTAQQPGKEFPGDGEHGKRSWSIIYEPRFDYVTQRPDGGDGSPGDLMIGGGFFRSKDQGMDQIGVWDDGRIDALPLMHLKGSMATVFEPSWGADGMLKQAWTGIMGFTGDRLPFVGRLPALKGVPQPPSRTKDGTMSPGQWVSAGYSGEGMVWAWLSGTAAAIMMLGKEKDDLEEAVGRPGGMLKDWFPVDEVKIDAARLRRADLKHLAKEL